MSAQWYSGTVVHASPGIEDNPCRHSGTVAQWYRGTVLQRYSATKVQWYVHHQGLRTIHVDGMLVLERARDAAMHIEVCLAQHLSNHAVKPLSCPPEACSF